MAHAVMYVDEASWDAPERTHIFVETREGDLLLFFREGAVTPCVLEAAWADYRAICARRAANNEAMRRAVTDGFDRPDLN